MLVLISISAALPMTFLATPIVGLLFGDAYLEAGLFWQYIFGPPFLYFQVLGVATDLLSWENLRLCREAEKFCHFRDSMKSHQ